MELYERDGHINRKLLDSIKDKLDPDIVARLPEHCRTYKKARCGWCCYDCDKSPEHCAYATVNMFNVDEYVVLLYTRMLLEYGVSKDVIEHVCSKGGDIESELTKLLLDTDGGLYRRATSQAYDFWCLLK